MTKTMTKTMTKAKAKAGRGRVGIDADKMRKDRKRTDKRGQGADLWQVPEGDTLVYVCPPVHEEDPVPYVEFQAHFQVGPNARQVVNLEFLEGVVPMKRAMAARGVSWEEAEAGWAAMAEYAEGSGNDRIQIKPRWIFNIVPMQYRRSKRDDWAPADREPMMIACGKQIYDGITDLLFDEGDITDPDRAILVQISRKGTKLSTEYDVKADTTSLKEPVVIDEELWDRIETYLKPGGEGDIYRQLSFWARTEEQVLRVIEGREDDEDDEDEKPKRGKAPTKVRTAASRRRPEPEPEEEEEEEEEVEEEEVEEEEEEVEEGEEEVDEEEEEVDEEDEVPEPPKRSPTRTTPPERKPKAKPTPPPEDEEDEDADALEAALRSRSRRRSK